MSKRRTIHTILKRRCDGGKSHNAYIPEITVEIRIHFPPGMSFHEVKDALETEHRHAMEELRDHFPEHS